MPLSQRSQHVFWALFLILSSSWFRFHPIKGIYTLFILTLVINRNRCMILFLPSFLGSLFSICPTIQYSTLHTKILEREKFLTLLTSNEDFKSEMSIPSSFKEDLLWQKTIFVVRLQRNYIRSSIFNVKIFSDAFRVGGLYQAKLILTSFGHLEKDFSIWNIWPHSMQ